MQRAAATGRAVASTRLSLSGSSNNEAGFIVYVPVRIDGKLLGWVTAAFLAEQFTEGLDVARGTSLDVQVTDGAGRHRARALLLARAPPGRRPAAPARRPGRGLRLDDDGARARRRVVGAARRARPASCR